MHIFEVISLKVHNLKSEKEEDEEDDEEEEGGQDGGNNMCETLQQKKWKSLLCYLSNCIYTGRFFSF